MKKCINITILIKLLCYSFLEKLKFKLTEHAPLTYDLPEFK